MLISDKIDMLIPTIKRYLGVSALVFRSGERHLSMDTKLHNGESVYLTIFDIKSISHKHDDINNKDYISIWTDKDSHITIWEDGTILGTFN